MNKILNVLNKIIESIFSKRLFVYGSKINPEISVKSKSGFWYFGNIFDTSDISYGIMTNGVVEKEETELVNKVCDIIFKGKNKVIFYDIGCNTGYYGINAAYRYSKINKSGGSRVHSFDPIQYHIDCVKNSAYLNRLEGVVTPHCFALGREHGNNDIYVSGSGTSLDKDFVGKDWSSIQKIEIKKLDDVVSEQVLAGPDFVKIDVEGHEHDVLLGATETIKKYNPVLYIEIAKTLKNLNRPDFKNSRFKDTFDILRSIGYTSFTYSDSKINEYFDEEIDGVRMYMFLNKSVHGTIVDALR